mmetsp:Transcript_25223/g.43018  ORF Transcript_25223/g.43018 Transcript_25223/m.43018 type:complete len:90 (-) Transcript_25223:823-1092(-)
MTLQGGQYTTQGENTTQRGDFLSCRKMGECAFHSFKFKRSKESTKRTRKRTGVKPRKSTDGPSAATPLEKQSTMPVYSGGWPGAGVGIC